uniref:Uncharacterized protein n=1 Tax=Candidatus Methanogaster sp. ANME-2c ERB4 TaxID=2759911 RepID=A0A7G9Y5Z7_9EURY|nr:hypothetical protein MJEPJOLK_00005 [Methanosarcinales archaeon ANME-2c ERB4]QNO44034.1 hypothetical protein JGGIPCKB_00007 [Methanosarcinales archaeon ANME-2c ERB4]
MDREEDFGAQSTFLQTKTKMKQNLIPSNFRTCMRVLPVAAIIGRDVIQTQCRKKGSRGSCGYISKGTVFW